MYILYDFQSSIFLAKKVSFFDALACFPTSTNVSTKKILGVDFDQHHVHKVGFSELTQECIPNGTSTFLHKL